jgi:hypothetical protein
MSNTLSVAEVNHRLIRLRNIERLYGEQKQRNQKLILENSGLKKKVAILESTVTSQQKIIEDFKLQIEELRIKVFGKKREKHDDDLDLTPPKEPVVRTSDSY